MTLPTLLASVGCKRIDVMKIDAEGAEYDVFTPQNADIIRGMRVICGELHSFDKARTPKTYDHILDYLKDCGFDVTPTHTGYDPDNARALMQFRALNRNRPQALRH